jgi:hypothetical protein
MSATQKPEPGTAVAAPKDRDANLTPAQREHMAAIRTTRNLTVAITNEAWGNALTPAMRHAVAEYMRRHKLDVSEVDVLGGRIYRNGYYYRRRIAEMRAAGKLEWSEGEHIGPNAQLVAGTTSDDPEIAAWSKAENFRRFKERVRWEVPADATHAYVVRIKLKTDGKVLEGCDWITPERKNKYGKVADPIGAEEPEKTVITRAWRRCGLLVAAEIPELRREEESMNSDAEIVDAQIEEIGATDAKRDAELARPETQLALPAQNDPYGDVTTSAAPAREAEKVEVGPRSKASEGGEARSQSQAAPASATPPSSAPIVEDRLVGPTFEQLSQSINKLLKHEKISDEKRAKFVTETANAKTAAQLEGIMGRIENIISDPF